MPVMVALMIWGNRWTAPAAGPTVLLVDRATGEPIEPHLSITGQPLRHDAVNLVAGPGAGPETRAAFALMRAALRERKAAG